MTGTVSPLHQAMKLKAARAMVHRYQALTRALDWYAERDDFEPGELAKQPDLARVEAEHDQRVLSAVQAYRHAGGCVLDSVVELPYTLRDDRPDVSAALQAYFCFRGIPEDAARIEADPSGGRCYFDSREESSVTDFLCNYYRQDGCSFAIKPLLPEQWTIPGLLSDQDAEELLARSRGLQHRQPSVMERLL